MQAACEQALARTAFNPNWLGDCKAPHAGALGFGRLRILTRWEPFPERACSLCGAPVEPQRQWESTVALYGPPRWCRRCLLSVAGTASSSKDEALLAVRHYTKLTGGPPRPRFASAPMPQELAGAERDALMAARMALPFSRHVNRLGLGPWPQMLVTAGVAPDMIVTSRGTQSAATDGHWCLSLFERAIDDFLHSHGIGHEREPRWPVHPTLNPSGGLRADWLLEDGTMVEAAGLMGDKAYAAKMVNKRRLADALGLRLVVITPEQVGLLEVPFLPWLPGA